MPGGPLEGPAALRYVVRQLVYVVYVVSVGCFCSASLCWEKQANFTSRNNPGFTSCIT